MPAWNYNPEDAAAFAAGQAIAARDDQGDAPQFDAGAAAAPGAGAGQEAGAEVAAGQ